MRLVLPRGLLDAVGDTAIGKDGEALEGEWRPGTVAEEDLAAEPVLGWNGDPGVQVEAERLGGVAAALLPKGGQRIVVTSRCDAAALVDAHEFADAERAASAGVERRERGGLVRRPIRLLGDESAPPQKPGETRRRALAHRGEGGRVGGRQREELRPFAVEGEDSVREHRVHVRVQVETSAEALWKRDAATATARDPGARCAALL
jgi:hypothetical protein